MTQPGPVKTKALNAYFVSRGASLTVALAQVGLDLSHLNAETISDDAVGRIARRFGLTFEKLRDLAATY